MDEISFTVFRDENERFRLRKWRVELNGLQMVDKRRMFGGPFFKLRLRLKMKLMLKRREQILDIASDLGQTIEY